MMTDDNIKLKSSDHHHHAHNDDDDDDVKLKSNLMNIIRVWFWTWIFFQISFHLMVILIWEMVILVIISILLQQTKWSTQKRIKMKVNDNIIFFSDLLNNAYLDAAHDHNTITIINQKPEKKNHNHQDWLSDDDDDQFIYHLCPQQNKKTKSIEIISISKVKKKKIFTEYTWHNDRRSFYIMWLAGWWINRNWMNGNKWNGTLFLHWSSSTS